VGSSTTNSVGFMILYGIRFLLVVSCAVLIIVYGRSCTVALILEERLFGVRAREAVEECDAFIF
jgi:hypothetical protein